jgi:DNA-binding transcriptional LysR family regulator
VSTRGSGGLVDALTDGSLDLALVSVPGRPPAGVHLRQLLRRPMELVLPAGHRLAGRPVVRIADLAGEQFVDFPAGYGNRTVVDRAFAAAGVDRHVSLEVVDISTGAGFVRASRSCPVSPYRMKRISWSGRSRTPTWTGRWGLRRGRCARRARPRGPCSA